MRRWLIIVALALLFAACFAAFRAARHQAAAGGSVPTPRADKFDQGYAFSLIRRQLSYGQRPAGSPQLRRLALELKGLLPGGRLEPLSSQPQLRNVTGIIPGRKPAILLAAHYDTEAQPEGFVGANDGAAGTAAVVTLARALSRDRVAGGREIRFVLFDGEEQPKGSRDGYRDGLRGSRDYLKRHGGEVGQVVLLDYVAGRGLRLPREDTSDPQLWAKLRSASKRVGTSQVFPDWVSGGVYDDHTPFLEAGIPSIDLIDFDYPWKDTTDDTLDKLSPRSLDVTGETVYQLISELRRR